MVSADLYQLLGIQRNATMEQVKTAYRAKAQQIHPDRNKTAGAEEKFKALQAAYEVLSDPDRRKKYDDTGNADAEDPREEAYVKLVMTFKAVVGQEFDVTRVDPVEGARQVIEATHQGLLERLDNIAAVIKKRKRILRRLRNTAGRENVLGVALEATITEMEEATVTAKKEIEIGRLMMKILDEYDYELGQFFYDDLDAASMLILRS